MISIKKVLNVKIASLVLALVFILSETCYSLRLPVNSKETSQRQLDAANGSDLTFGFGTRFGVSSDPDQYDPYGNWTILSHGGITEPEPANFQKLMRLYKNPSISRREWFCCYETSGSNPLTWRIIGLVLDISHGGEVLYADKVRDGTVGREIFYPFQLSESELIESITKARANRIINKTPLIFPQGTRAIRGDRCS